MEPKQEHILIVDDDKIFGEMLQRYVSSNLGYRVTFCESGEEAQRLLQQQVFHIVFLDFKMPGISGLEVLRWMNDTSIDVPVLMVTNLDSDKNAMEAIHLGAYDYIRKDQLDLIHLPILLESVIERHQYRSGMQTERRDLNRHLEQMEQLEQAIESLGSMIANSMSMLSLGIDECQHELLPHVPDADRTRFATALTDIKEEYNFVCSSVKSIVGLTQSFRTEPLNNPARKEEPPTEFD
jgi:CheY-like chemotaxis protein